MRVWVMMKGGDDEGVGDEWGWVGDDGWGVMMRVMWVMMGGDEEGCVGDDGGVWVMGGDEDGCVGDDEGGVGYGG